MINIKRGNIIKIISMLLFVTIIVLFFILKIFYNVTKTDVKDISLNAGGSVIIGDIDGCNALELYTMPSSDGRVYYCGNPLASSARRVTNSKQTDKYPVIMDGGYIGARQETTYNLIKSGEIAQSIAYAEWQQTSKPAIQKIIWASWQWSDYAPNCLTGDDEYTLNVNSGGMLGRSQRFANFIYRALENETTLNYTYSPTEEDSKDIKVMIDQNATTYTVGPYKLDFSTSTQTTLDGLMTLGDLVYDEIVNDYSGKFIWGQVTADITDENGEINSDTSNIEVLDASGNVISTKFPKFGQEFYIRYTSSEKIKEICPNIYISFVPKIEGTKQTYESSQVEYIIHDDYSGQVLKPVMRSYNYLYMDNIDGFVDLNKFNWGEYQNYENTLSDMKNFIENGLTNVAIAAGYPISDLTLDIGTKGNGYHLGIYTLEGGQFYEGMASIEKGRENSGSITEYHIREIDGREWWTESIPEGFSGTILETRTRNKYKDYAIFKIGSFSHREETDEHFDGESPSESAEDKLMKWLEENIRRAIVFDKDYPKITEQNKYLQSAVAITITPPPVTPSENVIEIKFPGRTINMYLGGYVWEDLGFTKESLINGRFDSNESKYAGIQVKLHDNNTGQVVATTTTDSNGAYGFKDLHPMHKYYVEFTYNGQIYQHTYYKDDLSGGYSTAQEKDSDRESLNQRFETIDSTPNNYETNKSYGLYIRIQASDGTYIPYNPSVYADGQNAGALRFCDVFEIFRQLNVNSKNINNSNHETMNSTYNTLNYERSYSDTEQSFKNKIQEIARNSGKTIADSELNSIWTFINHCLISAYTTNYPKEDRFVLEDVDNPQDGNVIGYPYLYNSKSDQSRNVDFGINQRDTADLALQKDVYKATVRVNGKTETYMYSNKDFDEDGNWEITIRKADGLLSGRFDNGLFNGDTRYTREIRKSEYLYDGTIYNAGGTDARDLKVYVTYRIVVRNQSQTYDTAVNEIVDYFDESEYVFDGTWNDSTQSYKPNNYSDFEQSQITSYIGDRDGKYIAPLTVKTESSLNNGRTNTNIEHGYTSTPLYLTGIVDDKGNSRLSAAGGMTYIYLTFEVKKSTDDNGMDNRIQMDVNTATGEDKGVGKQNIAEINSYSTYYRKNTNNNPALIPDYLDENNGRHDKDVSESVAGSVDRDSSVGNLTKQDLNDDGDLIISSDSLINRTEDDTDKAPNIRLVFPANDDYERVATGYVFEDNRNQESDQAMVGNGRYDEGETKINGVTVQLVELVQNVDSNGIPVKDANGNYEYLGEYIWNAMTWNKDKKQWENANSSANSRSLRYYSGQGNYENDHTIAPIISGVGATYISGYTFGDDSTGQYAFKAMPAGDFIIRFIYGDTTQTVLTTADGEGKEVVDLLKDTTADVDSHDGYISTSGLNAKSYNGQDYKSTTYQAGIDQSKTVVGSYNDIYGYGYGNETDVLQDGQNGTQNKYNTQNYNYTETAQPERGKAGEPISNYVNKKDGTNKIINYYYNIAQSQPQSGISDAKDVGNVREYTNEYSRGISGIDGEGDTQTLVNGRAEVLASGLKVASTDNLADGAKTSTDKQIAMLKELMENTEMVAQSGVINAEVEWNTKITNGQSTDNNNEGKLGYILEDIDLGLSERPVAQLKMNKEVSNVRITLQNGTILFDTNRPVTNMPFADHEGHKVRYSPKEPTGAYRLMQVILAQNSTGKPELITTYMDEELMYGARIEVEYTFTVTNVGEVDYLDNQFYYTGKTNNTGTENISTTTANTVVDYITNNIQFLPTNSKNTTWSIRTVNDLTTNPQGENKDYVNNPVGNQTELINNKYYNTLNTYNNIVTNKSLGDTALYPEAAKIDGVQSSSTTTMMLSTTLVPDSGEDTLVYNNLSEIIQVSNTQGRRLEYSIPGNQPMANQESGSNISLDENNGIYTKVDLVTPTEIDADSAQKILILPPTGANRNYALWIIVGIVALVVIAGGVVLIRKYFKKNK